MDKPIAVLQSPNKVAYNNVFQSFDKSQYVHSDCNEITFINNGATSILLNGSLALGPGDSISFDGKQWEIDKTIYNAVFSGAGINNLVVIRKFYNY